VPESRVPLPIDPRAGAGAGAGAEATASGTGAVATGAGAAGAGAREVVRSGRGVGRDTALCATTGFGGALVLLFCCVGGAACLVGAAGAATAVSPMETAGEADPANVRSRASEESIAEAWSRRSPQAAVAASPARSSSRRTLSRWWLARSCRIRSTIVGRRSEPPHDDAVNAAPIESYARGRYAFAITRFATHACFRR
jgi:hypothetical protein